jgi:hypothetical protein
VVRRKGVVAGVVGAVLIAGVAAAPAAGADGFVWFPAGQEPTTGGAVQIATQAVTCPSGGSVAGQASSWIEVPDSFTAAMDAAAGLSTTPIGWYAPSVSGCAQVVGVVYAGSQFLVPSVSGTYSWVTAQAWEGGAGGAIIPPGSASGNGGGAAQGASGAGTQTVLHTPGGDITTTTVPGSVYGQQVTQQFCGSLTGGACPAGGEDTVQYNGGGQVQVQQQNPANGADNTYDIYYDSGSGLQPAGPTTSPGGTADNPYGFVNNIASNNPIPLLGSGGKTIYAQDCQAPNLIVNGMCVLASSLPAGETVQQGVESLLKGYYDASDNCVTDGQCQWFTWQSGDPTATPNTGARYVPVQPAGSYPCGNNDGTPLYCMTEPGIGIPVP